LSKRYAEYFIVDILIALDKIKRYHSEFNDAQSFYYDEKSFDATMRELQIIGEAAKHLIRMRSLPESYRIIVDFRNLIVHEYFGIDADEIWDILHNELPPFEKEIIHLAQNGDTSRLLEIIQETRKLYRGASARFLDELYDRFDK
jgi:uncharacterized protein with HEPN domain